MCEGGGGCVCVWENWGGNNSSAVLRLNWLVEH